MVSNAGIPLEYLGSIPNWSPIAPPISPARATEPKNFAIPKAD